MDRFSSGAVIMHVRNMYNESSVDKKRDLGTEPEKVGGRGSGRGSGSGRGREMTAHAHEDDEEKKRWISFVCAVLM